MTFLFTRWDMWSFPAEYLSFPDFCFQNICPWHETECHPEFQLSIFPSINVVNLHGDLTFPSKTHLLWNLAKKNTQPKNKWRSAKSFFQKNRTPPIMTPGYFRVKPKNHRWMVATQTFFCVHPEPWGGWFPFWLSNIFSGGLVKKHQPDNLQPK